MRSETKATPKPIESEPPPFIPVPKTRLGRDGYGGREHDACFSAMARSQSRLFPISMRQSSLLTGKQQGISPIQRTLSRTTAERAERENSSEWLSDVDEGRRPVGLAPDGEAARLAFHAAFCDDDGGGRAPAQWSQGRRSRSSCKGSRHWRQ